MTIALGKTVPAGGKVSARITYAGTPHVAVRAPWDGGFVWAKTPGGQPWVATAVQMECCDMFWPCIDYPTYEPDRIDLHITVPAGLVAPSHAVFQGKRTLPDGRPTRTCTVTHPTLTATALNLLPHTPHTTTHKTPHPN